MNRLLDISIRAKMWGIVLLVVICGALILISMAVNLDIVENKFTEYEQGAARAERAVLSIHRDFNGFTRATRTIMLGGNYKENMKLLDGYRNSIPEFFSKLHQAIAKIEDGNDRQALESLTNDAEQDSRIFLSDGYRRMQALADSSRTSADLSNAWREYQENSIPYANAAKISFRQLVKSEATLRAKIQKETNAELHDAKWDLIWLVLVLFVVVSIAISLLARSIVHPVQIMLQIINSIEQSSDLTRRIPVVGKDELTHLSIGFNSMLNKFQSSLQQVSTASMQLVTAAKETQDVTTATLETIDAQKRELDMVAIAMNEMTSTVADVTRNAASAATAAITSDATAQNGEKVVERTIDSINHLSEELILASETVAELDQHSQQIQSILEVIQSIAEQTNLLALNAAIEAARAGEMGRGFAVVADEVRTLASRTQSSTEEIRSMIEKLQQNASRTVEVMNRSRQYSDNSVSCAGQAGSALVSITQSVAQINDMNTQIATAAEQQSTVAEEINTNLANVHQGITQSVVSSKQISANTAILAQTAGELGLLVAEFKV